MPTPSRTIRHRELVGLVGLGARQPDDRIGRDGATAEHHARRRRIGLVAPDLEDLVHGEPGGPVEDDPEGPVGTVVEHEDHRALEVRVAEPGRRHEQAADEIVGVIGPGFRLVSGHPLIMPRPGPTGAHTRPFPSPGAVRAP